MLMDELEVFLIEAAQRGDENAWRQLFERHFKPVYRFCLCLSGGREEMAEEITQQVFITAARNINRFNPKKATFRTWLIGIAKKIYMKNSAKENRRKWYETLFASQHFKKDDDSSQQQVLVYEALALLPAAYRAVLEAKYLEGFSVSQIAEDKGFTVKAAELLLARAREKFAETYKGICE
jgi:RNA polymerase sigma-70 factor, ECF subfamily